MTDKKLTIKKGFWWGAGSPKIFNWEKDGFHIYGVGINFGILSNFDNVLLTIEGKKYKLETAKAIEFCALYDSYKKVRGTRLGVVSKSLLVPQIYE